ncbi:MAG: hypothetical protein CVU05_07065 [Bacteroidetes bacterium HGW-Bacteroidetes-21]|nr:MAG: hypothetical protein CVU05_07065 [Bacteroidetes bacterium HGW-Bacteroidetes-21]
MRKAFIVILLFLAAGRIMSQQDPQFSLNSFNHLTVNPAFAGINQAICSSVIYRNQWIGFEGHPTTSTASVHMPFDIASGGIGINIIQDKLGFNKDFHMNLAYSYHVPLGEGLLGIGLGFGLIQKSFDGQELRSPSSLEGGTNVYYDPAIPHSDSKTVIDANMGLFYRAEKYYVGVSSTHLTQPQLNYDDEKNPFVRRHYYLTAAYFKQLPNPLYELRPSIFLKFDGTTAQYDLNTIVIFNKQIWGGLTYRFRDAFTAMVGFTMLSDLGFGLAYDITVSSLRTYESGSVELLLRYCYKIEKKKKRTVYKTVRFLENAKSL